MSPGRCPRGVRHRWHSGIQPRGWGERPLPEPGKGGDPEGLPFVLQFPGWGKQPLPSLPSPRGLLLSQFKEELRCLGTRRHKGPLARPARA